MKLWIDTAHPAPEDYVWCKSVNEAKAAIELREKMNGIEWTYYDGITTEVLAPFELISLDHDSEDYIKLLDWFKETGRNYPIHTHNMNSN